MCRKFSCLCVPTYRVYMYIGCSCRWFINIPLPFFCWFSTLLRMSGLPALTPALIASRNWPADAAWSSTLAVRADRAYVPPHPCTYATLQLVGLCIRHGVNTYLNLIVVPHRSMHARLSVFASLTIHVFSVLLSASSRPWFVHLPIHVARGKGTTKRTRVI